MSNQRGERSQSSKAHLLQRSSDCCEASGAKRRWKNFVDRLCYAKARFDPFQRVSSQSVSERHRCDALDVITGDGRSALERRKRPRSSRDRKLAAMPVYLQLQAELGNADEQPAIDRDPRMQLLRASYSFPDDCLLELPTNDERRRVALELLAPLDYLDALVEVGDRFDLSKEPEPIEQLRPKFAFFRIAGTNEHEPRRVID